MGSFIMGIFSLIYLCFGLLFSYLYGTIVSFSGAPFIDNGENFYLESDLITHKDRSYYFSYDFNTSVCDIANDPSIPESDLIKIKKGASIEILDVNYDYSFVGFSYKPSLNYKLRSGSYVWSVSIKNTPVTDDLTYLEAIALIPHAQECDYMKLPVPENTNEYPTYSMLDETIEELQIKIEDSGR